MVAVLRSVSSPSMTATANVAGWSVGAAVMRIIGATFVSGPTKLGGMSMTTGVGVMWRGSQTFVLEPCKT